MNGRTIPRWIYVVAAAFAVFLLLVIVLGPFNAVVSTFSFAVLAVCAIEGSTLLWKQWARTTTTKERLAFAKNIFEKSIIGSLGSVIAILFAAASYAYSTTDVLEQLACAIFVVLGSAYTVVSLAMLAISCGSVQILRDMRQTEIRRRLQPLREARRLKREACRRQELARLEAATRLRAEQQARLEQEKREKIERADKLWRCRHDGFMYPLDLPPRCPQCQREQDQEMVIARWN